MGDVKKTKKINNQTRNNGKKKEEPRPEENPEEKRPRSLKKSTRDRGHGTLCEHDINDVKSVDLHRMDISKRSFMKEFGTSGLLPERHQESRVVDFKLDKNLKTSVRTFDVAPGTYRLNITHNSLISSITGRGSIVSKVWLVNTVDGVTQCSMKSLTDTIQQGQRSVCYELHVPETSFDTETSIHVSLCSQSTHRRLSVSIQLIKVE